MSNENFRKACDDATELIESCWDCNQELDENGKPIDGLTFDERLDKKLAESDDLAVNNVIAEVR